VQQLGRIQHFITANNFKANLTFYFRGNQGTRSNFTQLKLSRRIVSHNIFSKIISLSGNNKVLKEISEISSKQRYIFSPVQKDYHYLFVHYDACFFPCTRRTDVATVAPGAGGALATITLTADRVMGVT
jgi:hypothetical protein